VAVGVGVEVGVAPSLESFSKTTVGVGVAV
jgi:hypothetical protein